MRELMIFFLEQGSFSIKIYVVRVHEHDRCQIGGSGDHETLLIRRFAVASVGFHRVCCWMMRLIRICRFPAPKWHPEFRHKLLNWADLGRTGRFVFIFILFFSFLVWLHDQLKEALPDSKKLWAPLVFTSRKLPKKDFTWTFSIIFWILTAKMDYNSFHSLVSNQFLWTWCQV